MSGKLCVCGCPLFEEEGEEGGGRGRRRERKEEEGEEVSKEVPLNQTDPED
jgi:hypothetical protein